MCNDMTHLFVWDEQSIMKFWDATSRLNSFKDKYFSRHVGVGIVRMLQYLVPLQGRILDFGCGPGYLIEQLLEAGISCEGTDYSAESIADLKEKFAGNPLWHGAKVFDGNQLDYPDDSFDLIVCLETIEHIMPARRTQLLAELRRVVKPGGCLFITTPNAEDITANMVFCPECGALYHPMQHIASFTTDSLPLLMSEHGYRTITCKATIIERFQQPVMPPAFLDRNLHDYKRWILWGIASLKDALHMKGAPVGGFRFHRLTRYGHHLIWLGEIS